MLNAKPETAEGHETRSLKRAKHLKPACRSRAWRWQAGAKHETTTFT
jgi:hypothetical protein